MKNCVLYKTVNIVGKRWTIHILLELYKGEKKEKGFNELKRRLGGVTENPLCPADRTGKGRSYCKTNR